MLGLSKATIQPILAAMQGVVATGVVVTLPSLSLSAPAGKVATLSLLHLRFVFGVAGGGNLPLIWEAVAGGGGG